jgi:hypothetical protein
MCRTANNLNTSQQIVAFALELMTSKISIKQPGTSIGHSFYTTHGVSFPQRREGKQKAQRIRPRKPDFFVAFNQSAEPTPYQ